MSTTNINHSLNQYNNTSSLKINNNPSSSTNPARTRITRACDHCQLRKTKCDSAKPRCSQCVKRNDSCTFTKRVCKRGPKPKRLTYPYPECKEKLPQKLYNTYPYPSCFPLNRQQISLRSNNYIKPDLRRSRYPQQPSTLNYNNLVHNSKSLTSTSYSNQNLLPIQTNSLPSLASSSTASSINSRLPSLSRNSRNLRLPSLANTLKLPPISNLINASNSLKNDINIGKHVVSSPSYYKLNIRRPPHPIYL